MSPKATKHKTSRDQSPWSRRPDNPLERPWPSPIPVPTIPIEDVHRVLKQILEQLVNVEERLERIEKLLAERAPPHNESEHILKAERR
ncbi:MAG: hypothetical protein JSV58_01860 [Candidatus Bathyarchaeota archaeon]|nr:MAG: hypothetical protein JSV58_01860 [Candidatus Bathyarchaeota archaeon]